MQAGFRDHIHPALEEPFKVLDEGYMVKEAPPRIKVHQKVYIALPGFFAPADRSEYPYVASAVRCCNAHNIFPSCLQPLV